jgi:hypothetical protein
MIRRLAKRRLDRCQSQYDVARVDAVCAPREWYVQAPIVDFMAAAVGARIDIANAAMSRYIQAQLRHLQIRYARRKART